MVAVAEAGHLGYDHWCCCWLSHSPWLQNWDGGWLYWRCGMGDCITGGCGSGGMAADLTCSFISLYLKMTPWKHLHIVLSYSIMEDLHQFANDVLSSRILGAGAACRAAMICKEMFNWSSLPDCNFSNWLASMAERFLALPIFSLCSIITSLAAVGVAPGVPAGVGWIEVDIEAVTESQSEEVMADHCMASLALMGLVLVVWGHSP